MADEPSRLRHGIFFCVRTAILVYLGVALLVYIFQARLLYHPTRKLEATPEQIGLPFEDVSFKSDDGLRISAWFVPAENAKGVIIFCHGNAGNISHRLDTLRIYHNLGFSVLLFDYRGYGRSEGKPSEAGTYSDARAAWDYLVKTRKVAPGRITIAGRSLGGAIAARLAGETQPRALILESAFTSVPNMAAKLYPFLPVRWLSRFSYDTRSVIAQIGCPVLVIHSKDDELVPFAHGEELFDAARPPKEFLEIRGDHNGGYVLSGGLYISGLRAFLMKFASENDSGG